MAMGWPHVLMATGWPHMLMATIWPRARHAPNANEFLVSVFLLHPRKHCKIHQSKLRQRVIVRFDLTHQRFVGRRLRG
jgi:hypothetical protein